MCVEMVWCVILSCHCRSRVTAPSEERKHHDCSLSPFASVWVRNADASAVSPANGSAHLVGGGGGGGDAAAALCCSKDHAHGHHHDQHHGPADAGAYVTLAVDFLHNIIDGIGCVGSADSLRLDVAQRDGIDTALPYDV